LAACPPLPFDAGTVAVSNGGTYPSTAAYACEGGDPPSDGDAERTCQVDGTWSGTAPTTCWVSPFEGSALMTAEMQQQVAAWLAELGFASAAGWERCYDSPNGDDKSSQSAFHSQCDEHERTISIAHTDGNGGRTFGGYAMKRWGGTGHDSTNDNSATADFLFKLGSAAAKYPPLTSYNQFDGPKYWPTWGGGHCLYMGDNSALGVNGYCNAHSSCPGVPDNFCGGDGASWGETEMEVWYALA
jgi:hypothetical protein